MARTAKKVVNLEHPCRGVCTGWQHGFDRGLEAITLKVEQHKAEVNRLNCRIQQASENMTKILLRNDKEKMALIKRRDTMVDALERVLLDIKKAGHKELYAQCLIKVKELMAQPVKKGRGREDDEVNV